MLVSPIRVHAEKYLDWFGIDLTNYPRVDLGLELRAFSLYIRLLTWLPSATAMRKFNPSIFFIDNGFYKPLKKYKEGRIFIEYIHFPLEVSVDPRYKHLGFYWRDDPYIRERYKGFMALYYGIYSKLIRWIGRDNPFRYADLVLVNSRWTANIVREVFGERPEVLNPPIAPSTPVAIDVRPYEGREDLVVMLGRFSEEKRYHWVIQEVYPRLKEEVSDVKLAIVGGAGTRTSRAYLNRLVDLASRLNLRVATNPSEEADLYLLPDASRVAIVELMDRARAFLHATINEHWGIAVAEAMARGLPVVVHRSGGTWSDLVGEGVYGLGYSEVEEAVEALSKLLTDRDTWVAMSGRSIERVRDLTLEKFTQRFHKLLQGI